MPSGASDAVGPRRRPWLVLACAGCVLLSRPSPGAPAAGIGFAALRGCVAPRTHAGVLRRAGSVGDDFDFGDMPKSKTEAKAEAQPEKFVTTVPVDKELPPVAKVASREELEEDMEAEEYDPDEIEEDQTSDVVPFVSIALLVLGVIGFLAYTVFDQSSAFGQKAAPKRQVVQAVYTTYFDEADKKELLTDAKDLSAATAQSSAENSVQTASS